MHGSDRVPDLNIDYERALVGTAIFIESEMALFYECMLKCARKLLDTADIVRDAMLHQHTGVFPEWHTFVIDTINGGAEKSGQLEYKSLFCDD